MYGMMEGEVIKGDSVQAAQEGADGDGEEGKEQDLLKGTGQRRTEVQTTPSKRSRNANATSKLNNEVKTVAAN